jgi:hypothetical protein
MTSSQHRHLGQVHPDAPVVHVVEDNALVVGETNVGVATTTMAATTVANSSVGTTTVANSSVVTTTTATTTTMLRHVVTNSLTMH